jgi:hypothetical protein
VDQILLAKVAQAVQAELLLRTIILQQAAAAVQVQQAALEYLRLHQERRRAEQVEQALVLIALGDLQLLLVKIFQELIGTQAAVVVVRVTSTALQAAQAEQQVLAVVQQEKVMAQMQIQRQQTRAAAVVELTQGSVVQVDLES